jgi:polysaccharide biosynthesis/export protein
MVRILLLVVVVVFISSCVPTKKYVLLQKNDLNRKDLPTDSIMRSYQLQLSNYKIQPQDMLSVQVETLTPDEYNFIKELNPVQGGGGGGGGAGGGGMMMRGYFVDNAGFVEFPVIGIVKLAGLSVFEAEAKMREVLTPFLRDPVVRIRLLNFRFTFVGEMNGQVTSFNPRISLLEAIAMAGGLPEFANRENIKIIRQRGDQADVLYVNLLDESFVASPNMYLQQNDIIVVSTLRQKQTLKYVTQNMSLILSSISFVLFFITLANL